MSADYSQIISSITQGAKLYKQYLMGKTFLYVFEGRFIETAYHAKEFRHLTGVATDLSALSFFNKAVTGTLQESQICFDEKHRLHLCKRKMKHIQNLRFVTNSDLIVLKDIHTHSETYQFAFTELNFTLCLGRDTDVVTKSPKNDYYIVKSLRDGDTINLSLCQYECNYIFSKRNDQALYDTLNYSDGNAALDSLSEAIKDKLSSALLQAI